MAKVYSLHMVALKAGVNAEEFERFFEDQLEPATRMPGMQWHLLKGDRGDRKGQYLLMFEFESVELRDRLFPTPGPAAPDVAEEIRQGMARLGPLLAHWQELATPFDTIYTDYREIVG